MENRFQQYQSLKLSFHFTVCLISHRAALEKHPKLYSSPTCGIEKIRDMNGESAHTHTHTHIHTHTHTHTYTHTHTHTHTHKVKNCDVVSFVNAAELQLQY